MSRETGRIHRMLRFQNLVSLAEIFFYWIKDEVKEKNGLANSKIFLISENSRREKSFQQKPV